MENDNENTSAPDRPLGYWLRAVDRLLSIEFARALDAEGVDRRDWMLLNAVDGSVDARWSAERLARKSGRVRRLIDRGWIAETDGTWTLTPAGAEAKTRIDGIVDGVRSQVKDAVAPEAYDTTVASLEAMAQALGGTENLRDEHRRGPGRRGFGGPFRPGFGRGFGGPGSHEHRGRDFGHGIGHGYRGFGPDDAACHGHSQGHGHGPAHRKGDRHGERAYERGFDAGYERGRAASTPIS